MMAKGVSSWPASLSLAAGISIALTLGMPVLRVVLGAPVSAYVMTLAGVAATAYARFALDGGRIPWRSVAYLWLVVLWAVWASGTSAWTLSPRQYMEDYSLLFAIVFLVAAVTFVVDGRVTGIALRAYIWLAVIVVLNLLLDYYRAGTLQGYDLGAADYYLVTAQAVGLGAVMAVFSAIHARGVGRLRRWGLPGLLFLGLALSLARGAMISALAVVTVGGTLAVWLARAEGRTAVRMRLGSWLLGTTVILAGTVLAAMQVERTAARLRRLFSGNELGSGGRGELWSTAWDNLRLAPLFGNGLGSSGLLSGTTEGLHPHNLVFQVWIDTGLIGLMLLIAILVAPYWVVLYTETTHRVRRLSTMLLGGHAFLLLEHLKSTSIYSGRSLFVMGALVVALPRVGRRDARIPGRPSSQPSPSGETEPCED